MDIINQIKKEFDYQINKFDVKAIECLAHEIENIKGNIYTCGVGKSGNVAHHCSDLLKSVSINSFFLDPLNAAHGDIGIVNENDAILMFSNSGNTLELVNLSHNASHRGVKIITICCNNNSKLSNASDITFITPFRQEISGNVASIPTNSYMSHLIFCNILISLLKRNITLAEYKKNHAGGDIGKNLLTVKDALKTEFPKMLFDSSEIDLVKVMIKMTDYKMGCCFFVDNNDALLGIVTDGDIRRLMIQRGQIATITLNEINKKYAYCSDVDMKKNEIFMNNMYVQYIPVIKDGKLLGVISYHD